MALVSPTTVTVGSVLTATQWNSEVKGNLDEVYASRRLGFQTRTTAYTANQTHANIASAGNMFSSDITFTADGTSTYWVEFYCCRVIAPNISAAWSGIYLTDGGSTTLGLMSILFNGASIGFQLSCHARVPITPSAGSFTINTRAAASTSSFTWQADTGGSDSLDAFPMWLAVYGPDLT